jgi:pimeloyl-ACP methyl ester carboxylesterase
MQIGTPLLRLILPGLLSGSKVIVTGHSRGGALATLFVFLLATNGFGFNGLYIFGSPKPGDAEFANHWRNESEAHPVRTKWMPSLVAFPITLLATLAYLLWALTVVPLKFRTRRILRKLWRKSKSADADDLQYTPIKDHFISAYLQSLLPEVEWRTKVSMIYYKIIERAMSSSMTAADIVTKEYASMTRIAEQVVANPDAIEQFCERHGLLSDSVVEWIGDYRTFTLTKEIKRRDQFFKEIGLLE